MEILPPAQHRLWPQLRAAGSMGLVLYDGTAIGLRLGHRQSVDFDFFSPDALDHAALRTAFPFLRQSVVLQDRPNTLTVLVPDTDEMDRSVKVSFFGDGDLHTLNRGEKRILVRAASDVRDLPAASLTNGWLRPAD